MQRARRTSGMIFLVKIALRPSLTTIGSSQPYAMGQEAQSALKSVPKLPLR
jgi:hypothetical protein